MDVLLAEKRCEQSVFFVVFSTGLEIVYFHENWYHDLRKIAEKFFNQKGAFL